MAFFMVEGWFIALVVLGLVFPQSRRAPNEKKKKILLKKVPHN